MEPYFIWNGVDSRTMGVVVVRYPPIVYPAERVETVQVPGRSGFLTRTEGEHIYNGYLKTVEIGNKRSADARAIASWLRGSGELVLGSEPNFVYYARVIKEASLDRMMPGVFSGSVGFMVQPEKGQMPPESAVTWSGSGDFPRLWNPGDVPAKPVITVHASALGLGAGPRIVLAVDENVIAGGQVVPQFDIDLSPREDLWGCVIDTENCHVTSLDGTENLDAYVTIWNSRTGLLWMPPHAYSYVSWYTDLSNITSVSIQPRWRWL